MIFWSVKWVQEKCVAAYDEKGVLLQLIRLKTSLNATFFRVDLFTTCLISVYN
jgi:hypothetical protein